MLARTYFPYAIARGAAENLQSDLTAFAEKVGLRIVGHFREKALGPSMHRPELFRLIGDSAIGDVLVVDQVTRFARLTGADWDEFRQEIRAKRIRIVASDVPASWNESAFSEEMPWRVCAAFNNMMLDVLSMTVRKPFEDRSQRQYDNMLCARSRFGRPENVARNADIAAKLNAGWTWRQIKDKTGCGPSHISKISKRLKNISDDLE